MIVFENSTSAFTPPHAGSFVAIMRALIGELGEEVFVDAAEDVARGGA